MTSPICRVQAFLAAGHVCTVMGTAEYPALAERFEVPIVVTGFEPLDILEGIRRTVHQLEEGRHEVENAYPRAVADDGQPGRDRDARGRLRGRRPVLARHRDDPAERLAALRALPRVRRRAPLRGRRHPHPGVVDLPQRRGAAGADQAARVRGVRQGVHAAQPARRHHGLQRGRLRGVLPLPAAAGACAVRAVPVGAGAKEEAPLVESPSRSPSSRWPASRAGPARCRCATARRS